MKRNDYISWDKYFMGVALLSAMRSKDPSTQVGACIVNNKKRIVGIGYNGFPYGVEDDTFPWESGDDFLNSKYPYVVHAEPNAILNSTVSLDNSTFFLLTGSDFWISVMSGLENIVFFSFSKSTLDPGFPLSVILNFWVSI